eukprot:scaffold19910_cov70-Phaeocystis_antarctica.AAC.3
MLSLLVPPVSRASTADPAGVVAPTVPRASTAEQSSRQVLSVGMGVALESAACAWATVTLTQIANSACPASNATASRRSLAAPATESVVMTTA